MSTHARDICYQYPADTQTDKQNTVNNISPACLSACGDKKRTVSANAESEVQGGRYLGG